MSIVENSQWVNAALDVWEAELADGVDTRTCEYLKADHIVRLLEAVDKRLITRKGFASRRSRERLLTIRSVLRRQLARRQLRLL